MARSPRQRLRTPPLVLETAWLKAVADPTRVAILQFLSTPGAGRMTPFPSGEIASGVGIAPATASHHLGILHDAGLVDAHSHGKERLYVLRLSELHARTRALHDGVVGVVRAAERSAAEQAVGLTGVDES
mgnify:CR=1 FL=1